MDVSGARSWANVSASIAPLSCKKVLAAASMASRYEKCEMAPMYVTPLLEPPQIDLFWVVPERYHRPRSPQGRLFPGWVPVLIFFKIASGAAFMHQFIYLSQAPGSSPSTDQPSKG